MKRLKNIRVTGRNKYELYVSYLVVFIGFIQTAHLPQNYRDVLVASSTLLVGLFCALNSLLDIKRMNWLERVIAVPWFALLLFLTPIVIWNVAQIRTFADR
jgi:hypothetical protein